MSLLQVRGFGVSLDGFAAGPDQSLANPLGEGGESIMKWFFATRTFQDMIGGSGGATGIDDRFAALGFRDVGAWIIGRNMFGPVRGPWPDETWTGWWGANPPFHVPVFVLTHHERAPLEMDGGTTFHFMTDGIAAALQRATQAAGGKRVRLGGGVATVRQYLQAGLIDELHLALSPVLMGHGENLFSGLNWPALGYQCLNQQAGEAAIHITLRKTGIS